MNIDLSKIDLAALADRLESYEGKWIAISEENEIVCSGATYAEVTEKLQDRDDVVFLKVPPLEYTLTP